MFVDDCETVCGGSQPHDHALFMRFHTTNHLGHSQVLGRNICKQLKRLVGERGFEPPTPWSRTRCSTRLSHSPTAGWTRSCGLELLRRGRVLKVYATGRNSSTEFPWQIAEETC
jgi:hypothetical protein